MAGAKKASHDKNKPKPKPNSNNTKPDNPNDPPPKLKPATAINSRHILCTKHSQKEAALDKLRTGAKFDDVAREFSEDKARQGGSLGWKVRGALDAAFEKVAYELEVSGVGSPKWGEVKTGHGYHVVMVEGRR